LALRSGPAPVPRRLSDQLAQRHDQQTSNEIETKHSQSNSQSQKLGDLLQPQQGACEGQGRETCRLRPSPEPVQDSVFVPTPPSRNSSVLPRAGQQKHCSLCAEAGRSRPKRLCRSAAIAVPIYGSARQRLYPRKDSSQGIVTMIGYKQKTFMQEHSHSK
jgi:hypothetical protein